MSRFQEKKHKIYKFSHVKLPRSTFLTTSYLESPKEEKEGGRTLDAQGVSYHSSKQLKDKIDKIAIKRFM